MRQRSFALNSNLNVIRKRLERYILLHLMAYSVNKNSTVQPVTTPSCRKWLLCLRAAVVFLFAINFLLCTKVCPQFIKFLCSRLWLASIEEPWKKISVYAALTLCQTHVDLKSEVFVQAAVSVCVCVCVCVSLDWTCLRCFLKYCSCHVYECDWTDIKKTFSKMQKDELNLVMQSCILQAGISYSVQ